MQLPMTVATLSGSRSKRLYDELAFAVSRADGAVLRQWGGRSAGRLMNLGARRVGGLASLATAIGKGTWSELSNMIKAAGQGSTLEHLGNRTAAAIDGSIALGKEGAGALSAIGRGLVSNPKETSAGIAYHLLVDAFIQPAPYHDLPFSMPIEGHQAAMAASGMAEGTAAARRGVGRGPVVILHDGLPEKSTGRKVVDGIALAASLAQTTAAAGISNIKSHWQASRKKS